MIEAKHVLKKLAKMNIDKSLFKKIKEKFLFWIQDLTLHGFPKIFKTDLLVLKVIWIFFTILSISSCCFFIINTINNFLKFEVTTVFRQKSQIPIEIPALSICHKQFFLTQQGNDFLLEFKKIRDIDNIFNSTYLKSITQSSHESLNMDVFTYLTVSNAMDYNISDNVKKSLGFNIDSYLISCLYSTQPCNIDEDFIWYFEKNYGNCYLFNSRSTYTQTNIGNNYAIRMEFLEKSLNQVNNLSSSKGIHITLFDPKTRVNSLKGIDLPSKYETNIIVNKKVTKRLPYPYSECLEDHSQFYSSEVYKATIKEGGSYTQNLCFDVCYQKSLINKCNCLDPNFAFFKMAKTCSNLTELFCLFTEFTNFFTKTDFKKICANDCPLECTRTEYEYKLSYSDFPTDLRAKSLVQMLNKKNSSYNYTFDFVKENSLKINIFYDKLEYEQIEELRKMETVDLVSNIGGLLGLFIGFSLLSLVELIEIIVTILFVFWNRNDHNKVIKVQPKN